MVFSVIPVWTKTQGLWKTTGLESEFWTNFASWVSQHVSWLFPLSIHLAIWIQLVFGPFLAYFWHLSLFYKFASSSSGDLLSEVIGSDEEEQGWNHGQNTQNNPYCLSQGCSFASSASRSPPEQSHNSTLCFTLMWSPKPRTTQGCAAGCFLFSILSSWFSSESGMFGFLKLLSQF